jgi:hypothetical protein
MQAHVYAYLACTRSGTIGLSRVARGSHFLLKAGTELLKMEYVYALPSAPNTFTLPELSVPAPAPQLSASTCELSHHFVMESDTLI